MWLPGQCSGNSHIILQHKDAAGADAGPEEKTWTTLYGQVHAALVPANIYNMTVKVKVHHLGDLVSEDQDLAHTRYSMQRRGVSDYQINLFSAWFRNHRGELFRMRAMEAPLW